MNVSTERIETIVKPPSLLILVAGFEDRSRGILDTLKETDLSGTETVLLTYIQQNKRINELNEKNKIEIENFLGHRVKSLTNVPLNHLNPFETIKSLRLLFKNFNEYVLKDIMLDVSACIDGLIPILILDLISYKPHSLSFLYTRPEFYHLEKVYLNNDFELKKLDLESRRRYLMTSGLSRVDYFEGFEGLPNPLLQNLLIFSVGFEINKVDAICSRFEDTKKIILYGRSSMFNSSRAEKISREIHKELRQVIQFKEGLIENFDVNKIIQSLLSILALYKDYNVLLCSFATKPQIIANTIIALKHPKIALMRVILKNYEPRLFSYGIKEKLLISIEDFSS
ncbi:MAG: hypothetical protein ACXADY_13245 [Candidatus Hodarchaeales archaeon]